jgi:hypothetical protein
LILKEAKRFGLLVAHPDQDGKVSDLNTGHTNKNGIYCFSAFAGHTEIE